MKGRILIVEDDRFIAEVLADHLRAEGHTVDHAADGPGGLHRVQDEAYDLLVLDVMLPGMTGVETCRRARENGFGGGILMLTARGETTDKVTGLQAGADDYLVKPYSPDELAARLQALLRRVQRSSPATPATPAPAEFGNVTADFIRMAFSVAGQPVSLAAKEAELLRLLITHAGQTLSRETILREVWSEQPHITARTVDVHIAWLRKKLEPDPAQPRYIHSVRGVGYKFAGD